MQEIMTTHRAASSTLEALLADSGRPVFEVFDAFA